MRGAVLAALLSLAGACDVEGAVAPFYYMVVGDWGAPLGGPCVSAQREVAALMRQYAARRRGHELLAVLSVGDAFYWTGVGSMDRFRRSWREVYEELTAVPWLNVMGNHDWGNDDHLACAGASRLLDASRHPAETQGERAKYFNFRQPDFNYFWALDDLLEVVAIDTNGDHVESLGGDGPRRGARRLAEACGGEGELRRRLGRIRQQGRELLEERSRASRARNVALLSHYPDDDLKWERSDQTVLHFVGHVHDQRRLSDRRVLTGGGGGCCPPKCTDGHKGFVVVSFRCRGGAWAQYVDCVYPNMSCSVS